MEYLHYAAITAVVLAAAQAMGPKIRNELKIHSSVAASFGGGVAIAYAFLQLFPELEVAHEWLGRHVHTVALASFLGFYILEIVITRNWSFSRPSLGSLKEESPSATAKRFWFHVAIIWFYTWMVMFTLPDEAADSLLFATVGSLTIGIHLIYKDYVFRQHYEGDFQQSGRYILASAPLAGWLANVLWNPSEAVQDIFIAVLVGVLLQSVFRDELPEARRVQLSWLLAGVATFAVLSSAN